MILEYWNIYDKNGDMTDRKHRRGEALKSGDFHMVVENWIKNSRGEFLIQKRNKPLREFTNPWPTTAGAAVWGESSLLAIQRETREEMGLFFKKKDFRFIQRSFFDVFFMDVYETTWDGNIEDIKFDPVEVSDVKWASITDIQRMHQTREFYSHRTPYLQEILDHSDNSV